ncbi:MAG: 50S ribosomal protein L34 [Candidatus Saganbacteria bacterium]|nr:50S ribosomal protein L34 [Candidatus Saganbacteria bacterium]
MVKRTFQPHNRKRKRTHGYLSRKKRGGGVNKARRKKGRKRIAP